MRVSEGALAWITRDAGPETEWLVRWNVKWESFSLVGGHREDGESFRECLIREIHEEMGLSEGDDYAISTEPILHTEYCAFSKRANEDTQYRMELFRVSLSGEPVEQRLEGDARLNWVSEGEILCGRTRSGKPVSDTVQRFHEAYGKECDAADRCS